MIFCEVMLFCFALEASGGGVFNWNRLTGTNEVGKNTDFVTVHEGYEEVL